MSGSWKVAYADFVTAMMAFFLLMWLLNTASEDTKQGLAGYFKSGGRMDTSVSSPIANNPVLQNVDKLDVREFQLSEVERSHYSMATDIKNFLLSDPQLARGNGITTTGVGVLLHVSNGAIYEPNSLNLTEMGKRILDQVSELMRKYKVYLVIRGHCSADETGSRAYPTKWDLSAARAASSLEYILAKGGVDERLVRSVAYADTRPLVDGNSPEALARNRRVEFFFHRPEVMTTIVGY